MADRAQLQSQWAAHAGLDGSTADLVDGQGESYPCKTLAVSASALTCTVPDAPAGLYQLRVTSPSGYANFRPILKMAPQLTSVSPAAGSLAGGLTVTLQASGAPFDTDDVANNRVLIGNLPCDVQSVTATQLTCTTPRAVGVVPTLVRRRPLVGPLPRRLDKFALHDTLFETSQEHVLPLRHSKTLQTQIGNP